MKIFAVAMSAVSAVILTGCCMCSDPIDLSCVEPSHETTKYATPDPLRFAGPTVLASTDTFRPTFRAGTERISAVGLGLTREDALGDAVVSFKRAAKCDYIVAANIEVVKTTHPTWRWFRRRVTNYQVTLTGLPIFIDKLVRSEKAPEPIVKTVVKTVNVCKCPDIKEIVKALPAAAPEHKCAPLGMLKLTDIDVQIKAKGATDDKAGVIFPAKAACKK